MIDWLPIDSAPRDRTTVLVADSFGVVAAAFDGQPDRSDFENTIGEKLTDEEWAEECEGYTRSWVTVDPISGDIEYLNPSHWAPLPSAPADASGSQRSGESA